MKLHDLSLATRITIGVLSIVVAGAAMLIFSEAELIATIPANTLLTEFMAILLLAGIATLVLRRMLSPLRQITVAADKITAGDYDILLPRAAGGEIGSLTNALNTMLTKLSQREKLLQESETKYRRLHESMMDAFVMVDMSGRLIEFNHVYREMLGYAADELQRLTYVDLTPEKWHAFEAQIVEEQVIPYGYSQVYEKEYIHKDGTIFPVELKTFLLWDANNQPEAMWAIVRDITGRKRVEEELQRFFNLIPDLVCIASTDGHFLKINAAWQAVLGYTEQELLSIPFLDFIHPDDRDATTKEVARQLHGEATINFINRYRRKDGSYRWLDWKATPAVNNTMLYATARDITERKQTEAALRNSALRYQLLFESSRDALMLVAPPSWKFTGANQATLKLFGASSVAEFTELGPWDVSPVRQPDGRPSTEKAQEMIAIAMREGTHFFEWEHQRLNGQPFSADVLLTRMDVGGELFLQATVRDITGRKRVERQLHELTAHLLSVREEEKADIAREIHDDLGGTLTALKMKTYWLKTELSASKETTPLLDHVKEMSQLIDNAMGVMRHVVTGLRPTILDDLGLLAALEWQATQFHQHTGIECRVNCVCDKSDECTKDLDKPRSIALFRISQEALTNVARHSGASLVEIEFYRNDEEIVLSVIDNGRGLTENRTEASIPYGIRGMCERVDQLGGKINFDTPPGGGFNVTVILPIPDNEEEKA